jgi:hypothetical protein
MLRWSAEETRRTIDVAAIVDPAARLGLEGGSELIAVADLAIGTGVDGSATYALAARLGAEPAVRAAAVAGAFELYNRIVDAAGLPVGRAQREALRDVIATLGLDAFPHAGHSVRGA